MANKIEAKLIAQKIGLPIIPGSEDSLKSFSEAKLVASKIGYPVIIKSTNGGGGRGIKVVTKEKDLKNNYLMAKKEAEQSFGNDDVYIEKYLANPRHIEVQVIGDGSGNLIHIEKENVLFKEEIKK